MSTPFGSFVMMFLCVLLSICYKLYINSINSKPELFDIIGWDTHHEKIINISTSIRSYYLKHNESNMHKKCIAISRKQYASTIRSTNFKQNCKQIDVHNLQSIISINHKDQTAWIESNMNMENIYDQLISYNYTLKVIPEFKHITIGGAINGYGIESTSWKYGLLHNTVKAYEIILFNNNATILTINRDHELFDILPGSFNTIALITAVQIELNRLPLISNSNSSYYMHVQYKLLFNQTLMLQTIHTLYKERYDIDSIECMRVDGMKNAYVIAIGKIVSFSTNDSKVNVYDMSKWWHRFYYLHVFHEVVDVHAKKLTIDSEYIELKQYVFRHDLGAFWVINDDPAIWGLLHFKFMRFLFQFMLESKDLYEFKNMNWNEIDNEFNFAVHDYIVPYSNVTKFMDDVVNEYFGVDSVLWICPVVDDYDDSLQINIGIYLTLYKNNCETWSKCVQMYRDLEINTITYGGKVWYYSSSFLTRSEFEMYHLKNKQYDYEKYVNIRRKYKIETFDLYDKIGTIGDMNHSKIHLVRPRYKYLSHFPIAWKYAAWWLYKTFTN